MVIPEMYNTLRSTLHLHDSNGGRKRKGNVKRIALDETMFNYGVIPVSLTNKSFKSVLSRIDGLDFLYKFFFGEYSSLRHLFLFCVTETHLSLGCVWVLSVSHLFHTSNM